MKHWMLLSASLLAAGVVTGASDLSQPSAPRVTDGPVAVEAPASPAEPMHHLDGHPDRRGGCHRCTTNLDCDPTDSYCAKPEGECEGTGRCMPRPQACPAIFRPA